MKKKIIIGLILTLLVLITAGTVYKLSSKSVADKSKIEKSTANDKKENNTIEYEVSKKSYENIEKSKEHILSKVDKINEKNNIEYYKHTMDFSIKDGDYFIYENDNKDIKEGFTFWRYKIVLRPKSGIYNNLIEVEYKLNPDSYADQKIDISNLNILEYGDSILGDTDRDIEEINKKINSYLHSNSEETQYSIDIDYSNENGQDRITVYKDKIEYTVLSKGEKLQVN